MATSPPTAGQSHNVDPARLAAIGRIPLDGGQHGGLDQGACAMEAVAYIAGERWSDAPACASPVIAALIRALNDALPRRQRQSLKAHLPRLVSSRGNDAQETQRAALARRWLNGPGQTLPRGKRGRQLAGAAIAAAQTAAPTAGQPGAVGPGDTVILPRPRRVSRTTLDALHQLIDQLLTTTDPTPDQDAPEPDTTAAGVSARDTAPGDAPAREGAPARGDVLGDAPASAAAPGGRGKGDHPAAPPGRGRVARPRRLPARRLPARRKRTDPAPAPAPAPGPAPHAAPTDDDRDERNRPVTTTGASAGD